MLSLGAAAALAVVHFRERPAPAATVRFGVAAPENGVFGNWLALSPDGRQLGFPGTSAGEVSRVWLRSLDSLELRPLAGTDGATATTLFWSPDSRSAVFQGGGKLKRIEIAGGPPQSLCDSPAATLGGAWNTNGVILIGNNAGPILRVPSSGGAATPITRVERSRGETFHSDPIFLTDQRHFLYFRHSVTPENQGVFVGLLDVAPEKQDLKRIETVEFSPAYAPPRNGGSIGRLLFLRDTTLMAQPFDERSLALAGEAVPVAERVGTSISRAFFSVSANDVLVYRSGTVGNSQLFWYDRSGRNLGPAGAADDYLDLTLAPDSSLVAYVKPSPAGGRQIWIGDLARGIHTRLTFQAQGAGSPVWSPDGRRVAYSSVTSDGIYVQDVRSTGSAQLLYKTGERTYVEDWSRDGRFVMFALQSSFYHLFALTNPSGGGEPKRVEVGNSEFSELNGSLSPDSHWIAYESYESGRPEIYVRSFPPGDGRANKTQISSGGGQQPRWRADGKELFYVAANRMLMAADVRSQPEFQAATPHALFLMPPSAFATTLRQWDVTGDGKRFLMVAPFGSALAQATVVLNWQSGLKK